MGKGFGKQTKTIKDQGEKQIKAIRDKIRIKSIEKFTCRINDSPIVLKEKEIYNRVDIGKLVFKHKGNTPDEDFSKFDNALDLINKIRDGEISLNEAKDEQGKLKSSVGEIKRVQKTYLLKESREARTNIENLYNARKASIVFFDEYTSRASEARCQANKQEQDLKY